MFLWLVKVLRSKIHTTLEACSPKQKAPVKLLTGSLGPKVHFKISLYVLDFASEK